jgi:Tol biopolymer transport system component
MPWPGQWDGHGILRLARCFGAFFNKLLGGCLIGFERVSKMFKSKFSHWSWAGILLVTLVSSVSLVCLVSLVASVFAAENNDAYHYKHPIVFCREEDDPNTLKTSNVKGGENISSPYQVLFASKIWIMESDGSHARQLTSGTTYDDHPSLYSDLEHILYAEMPVNEFKPEAGARLIRLNIYTGERQVYAEVPPGCAVHHASLSPIGDKLVYMRECYKPYRLSQWVGWGPGSYELTNEATNGVWLPPDSVIFMDEKNRDYTPRQVSIARMYGHGRGSKIDFLTDDCCLNRRPAISPDAKLFAWQTNMKGGEDEIFVANIDGSNPHDVSNAKGNDGHPWFSRDGKWIVFESDRTGPMEIWKLNLETLQATQLTHGGKRYNSYRPRM